MRTRGVVRSRLPWVLAATLLASLAVGLGSVFAVSTALPTHLLGFHDTIRWGSEEEEVDGDGFRNELSICDSSNDGFGMVDAAIVPTAQTDSFDGAGLVRVGDTYYEVPGGGPVDVVGKTLSTSPGPLGSLNASVQWTAMESTPAIRELVTLHNPGPTPITQLVTIDSNVGSDSDTTLQASSTGDISTYPTTARWFVTDDSDGTTDPALDPVVVSVATGPGAVESPATIAPCPETNGRSTADAANARKAMAAPAASESSTTTGPSPTRR